MTQKQLSLPRLFSPEFLLKLFLVCAFPLHLWTLLMAFRDFAWVAIRTYTWDAVGLVSYALVVALLESLAVFILVWLVGLLLPWRWNMDKRLAVLGTMFLVVASWSILSKIYTAFDSPLPLWFSNFLIRDGHPLRILWAVTFGLVLVSASIPTLLVVTRPSAARAANEAFDRIFILSGFYIFLDLIGIVIIVIRNMH